MLQNQTFYWEDFSGGITDDYVNADPKRYMVADNLLITNDGKLEQRPGSTYLGGNAYRLPSNLPTNAFLNFDNDAALLAQSSGNLYRYNTAAAPDEWTEILGPTSASAFANNPYTSQELSWGNWQGHLFACVASPGLTVTTHTGSRPLKVYKDSSGTYRLRTAGLPAIDDSTANYVEATVLANAILLANDLKTKLLAHFEDYRITLNGVTRTNGSVQLTRFSGSSRSDSKGTLGFVAGDKISGTDIPGTATISSLSGDGTTIFMPLGITATSTSTDATLTFESPTATVGIAAHDRRDVTAKAHISAVSNASNLATLLTLTNALAEAYTAHISDAIKEAPFLAKFHGVQSTSDGDYVPDQNHPLEGTGYTAPVLAGYFDLVAPPDVATLVTACELFDDMKLKYNLHDYSLNSHGVQAQHLVTEAFIGRLTSGPTVTANLDELYTLANAIKAKFEAHVGSYVAGSGGQERGIHIQAASYALPADATDRFTLINLMFHLNKAMYLHIGDAAHDHVFFNAQVDSGLDTLDSATVTGPGSTVTTNRYIYEVAPGADDPTASILTDYFPLGTRLDDTTLPSFSANQNATAGSGALFIDFVATLSLYHPGTDPNAPEPDAYLTQRLGLTDLYDLDQIAAKLILMKTFFNAHDNFNSDIEAPSDEETQAHFFSNQFQITTPDPVVATWSYAFARSFEYEVGVIDFLDVGPVLQIEEVQTCVSRDNATEIASVPALANLTGDHYDLTTVKWDLYRTVDNGSTYFKVASIANGTATYSDTMKDETLLEQAQLYTNGGVLNNDPPPVCKFLHVFQNRAYYGYITDVDDGSVYPNRLLQSVDSDLDSVPAGNFLTLPEPLAGISSTPDKLIVFSSNSVYRVEGAFDELGRGGMTFDKISNSTGLYGLSSCVQTEDGLFFAGIDGFYFTDGYQVKRISRGITQTYANFKATAGSLNGTYDRVGKRIWWVAKGTAPGLALILDLKSGLSEDMPFTTMSEPGATITSLMFFDEILYRGSGNGYVLYHDFATIRLTDAVIQSGVDPATWSHAGVVFDWRSVATDLGFKGERKYMTKFHFMGKAVTSDLSVQVNMKNDNGATYALQPILSDLGSAQTDPKTGDYGFGFHNEWKRFTAGNLKCGLVQAHLTNHSSLPTDEFFRMDRCGITFAPLSRNKKEDS